MPTLQRITLLVALFAFFVTLAHGATIAYCSPDNTGADAGYQAVYNQFQSDGSCQVNCQDSYAFAVLQGANCWCSDYAPSDQKQTNLCNDPCPGFPGDWCGNPSAGLYGYVALSIAPSGTIDGASPSTQASLSIASTQPSTLVASPSPTPNSSPSPTPAPSPSTATEAITSVTTVTGQAKTIIIPAPSATADPTLGQGSVSSNGINKGTVVGIVLGVALGIGLLIGIIVWFCVKRRHIDSTVGSTPPFGTTLGSSFPSHSGIPSRQVSQMSSAGLLAGKGPRIQTTGHGMSNGPRSAEIISGFPNDRRSLGTDQRLNPYALFAHDEARQSNISLQDNQDYSRQLRVANPDP